MKVSVDLDFDIDMPEDSVAEKKAIMKYIVQALEDSGESICATIRVSYIANDEFSIYMNKSDLE
jgi:hypothetical protein